MTLHEVLFYEFVLVFLPFVRAMMSRLVIWGSLPRCLQCVCWWWSGGYL